MKKIKWEMKEQIWSGDHLDITEIRGTDGADQERVSDDGVLCQTLGFKTFTGQRRDSRLRRSRQRVTEKIRNVTNQERK